MQTSIELKMIVTGCVSTTWRILFPHTVVMGGLKARVRLGMKEADVREVDFD